MNLFRLFSAEARRVKRAPRNRLWLADEVQRALLMRLVLHWFCFLSVCGILLSLHVLFLEQTERSWSESLQELYWRYLPVLLVGVVLFPAFLWDSLKLSHRFAGPLLRLRKEISRAADGHAVPPLDFRENDFWRDLSTQFNRLVQRQASPASLSPATEVTTKHA